MHPAPHPQPVLGRYASEALSRRQAPALPADLPGTPPAGRFMIAYDGLRFVHSGHRFVLRTGRHDQSSR